jgi:hypothetical protein
MQLTEFFALPHRFRWGGAGPWADDTRRGDDCRTFVSSWCFCAHGVDPVAELRGTYSSREQANDIVRLHGGDVALARHYLEPVGFCRVDDPRDGDIGLCTMIAGTDQTEASLGLVGAIRFGTMWAAIAPHGVVVRRAEHIACWRLSR